MKADMRTDSKAFKNILRDLKLHDVFTCKVTQIQAFAIRSGEVNQAYKLISPDKQFLLKIFKANSVLPIDRVGVFKLQEELAILGLAPKPIYLSQNLTVYCEEWLAPKQDLLGALAYNKKLELLADALYNIHSSFVSVPILPLLEHWKIYWKQIQTPSAVLRRQYQTMQTQWQHYLEQHQSEFVLCHNDLHFDHIASAQGPFYDWEYAAKGCRYLDIANCASINDLDNEGIKNLCDVYAEVANLEAKDVRQKVQLMLIFVDFTNELWRRSLKIA
jgi:thiamine kinase-like enzyme